MTIKVGCGKCQSTFAVRDDFAGKSVKCPKCSSPMSVPGGANGSKAKPVAKAVAAGVGVSQPAKFNPLLDLLDEAGVKSKVRGPSCPQCATEMSPTAVICVHCGYNVATGERLTTHVLLSDDEFGTEEGLTDAEKILAKAEREIDKTPVSSFGQDFGEGNESYMIAVISFVILFMFIGFSIAIILMMDSITELISPEKISLTASIVLTLGCMTYVTIIAFMASPGHGIACVATIGVYCIFFAFMQGKGMIVPAIVMIASILIGIVSILFLMYGNAEPEFGWLESAHQVLAVLRS